jgi:hypothetical protein
LHFYTVPLAIFLRRARELDFSTVRDSDRSVATLRRVFRVYSPEVVATISRLLSPQAARDSPPGAMSTLVAQHVSDLGPYAPPGSHLGGLSLASCQSDMRCLLEEVYTQHLKRTREVDMFDKFASYVESFFVSGPVFHKDERMLERLLESARVIVQFPLEDPIVRSHGVKSGTETSAAASTAEPSDLDAMRRQGIMKGDALQVAYQGDPMLARPRSYEIAVLVHLVIWLSQKLNAKFGLDQPTKPSFLPRINLRFLADYRNLLFIAVMIWLLRICIGV